jgi:hypothetical protein
MISIFNSPFRVTQKFGVNPEDYKKFGLAGHEGLDVVPTGTDWTVFSLPIPGICVKDIDMTDKGGNYGIHNTIWYPSIKEAWMFCHLSSNRIFIDQELPASYPIGVMGATGNTTGAHVHINRFQVDERGYRQNKDNGFLGGIDPLPFLMETEGPAPQPPEEDQDRVRGIRFLDEYRAIRELGPEGNYESFVRSVVESDRKFPALLSEKSTLTQEIKTLKEDFTNERKILREELKNACGSEKLELEKNWQLKVESAKKAHLFDYSAPQLLGAGFAKLFGKKEVTENES